MSPPQDNEDRTSQIVTHLASLSTLLAMQPANGTNFHVRTPDATRDAARRLARRSEGCVFAIVAAVEQ